MSYKNIIFCSRNCDNKECFRNQDNIENDAIKNSEPISWRHFGNCNDYVKPYVKVQEIKQEDLF